MGNADQMTVRMLDREYGIAPPFTNRELHIIKQVAGVRAGEMWDALDAGDNDVLVALAHIAVRRTGAPRPSLDELWDLPAGGIEISLPDDEDTEDPTTPANAGASEPSGSQETTPSPDGDGNTAPSST